MSIDYKAVLADLEAKKAALETSIASLRMALGLGAVEGESSVILPQAGDSIDLPVGAFLGKSIPAAIKMYLKSVKRKQTIREIAAALKDGGIESTSENFETVVAGALHRLKVAEVVLRFKDGWGLAEFYPEHIRSQDSKRAKKKTKKRKAARRPKRDQGATRKEKDGGGLEYRIEALLRSDGSKVFSAKEVGTTLRVGLRGVALALGRMAKKNKAVKAEGGYRAFSKVREMPRVG